MEYCLLIEQRAIRRLNMKIIFMGTPEFAVPCLQALLENKYDVTHVFTQPDRAQGRGQKIQLTPVKEFALKHDIEVCQPDNINTQYWKEFIKELQPDLIIAVAYGQILKQDILDAPKYGCVNVHASLLPKYRGAAPINWSIINGETITGVTTMYMERGLDCGNMIMKRETVIEADETAGQLHDKLSIMGAGLLLDTIKAISEGKADSVPQNNTEATYAPIMSKSLGKIDWSKPAKEINNLIRGVNPWPSAYSHYNEKLIKIWKAEIEETCTAAKPGMIIKLNNKGIHVSTGKGCLVIKELQPQNGKRMDVASFLRGNSIELSTYFD
jgi:methionyl-tRNA formyltransferase